MFFTVKKGEEVSFVGNMSKVACWKSTKLNKLKFRGKLVRTILRKFVEGIVPFGRLDKKI